MSTMLYAHWEGYCKHLFDCYIRLILRQKPLAKDLNNSLAMQHIRHALLRANSGDLDGQERLLALLRGKSTERVRLVRASMSDTKSNLRYGTFCDLLNAFGVDEADFATKEKLIDSLLCDRRNVIAHGRASFPDPEDVLELRENVDWLMDHLRDVFVGQVRTKAYRRD
jgi:hypothetical protein